MHHRSLRKSRTCSSQSAHMWSPSTDNRCPRCKRQYPRAKKGNCHCKRCVNSPKRYASYNGDFKQQQFQKVPILKATWDANRNQRPSKCSPKTSKMQAQTPQNRRQIDPEESRSTKKSKNNIDPTKKKAASHRAPPFLRKMWPTWPQLGSQEGAKMKKKSMQKSIKNLMPLGMDFCEDFIAFFVPKCSQVGTKMASKIDINFEGRKPTKR